jgi:hypothetical protein
VKRRGRVMLQNRGGELMTKAAQERLIEGARKGGEKGGRAEKHFTLESKERQIEGARKGGEKGGKSPKHFTPESKERQIEGARKGGQHSHGGHGRSER